MKTIKTLIIAFSATLFGMPGFLFAQEDAGTYTDPRDSHEYDWVKIGDQIWMAENLAYLPSVSPSTAGSETEPFYYVYGYEGSSVVTAKGTSNYTNYGVLYNWSAALAGTTGSSSIPSGIQGVCPAGWHLPSDAEWTTLTDNLGGEVIAGGKLKETGTLYWNDPNVGATNETGFTGRAGGQCNYESTIGRFNYMGIHSYMWSSTEGPNEDVRGRTLTFNNTEAKSVTYAKSHGKTVRCLKDPVLPTLTTTAVSLITNNSASSGGNISDNGGDPVTARGVCWSTDPDPSMENNDGFTSDGSGTGTFTGSITGLIPNTIYYLKAYAANGVGTAYGDEISFTTKKQDAIWDIDGYYYNTVAIGGQLWMAENLKTTRYNNGDLIPDGTDAGDITSETAPQYWWIGYDDLQNLETYGRLYTGYVAEDARNVCPDGWHVPSKEEWIELTEYLGGETVAGGALKESGTEHWLTPNTGATNISGFTGLPGGVRSYLGGYVSFYRTGSWWSSTNHSSTSTYSYLLFYQNAELDEGATDKRHGYSIRCLSNVGLPELAEVETDRIYKISKTTAICDGIIVSDGNADIVSKGVCWSTSANPTLLDPHTDEGPGSNLFQSDITGLNVNTTYYARTYATNSIGTVYGDEKIFTTYRVDAISDLDANFYNIVTIGDQVWTQENLKVTHFANGDPIPDGTGLGDLTDVEAPVYWFTFRDDIHYADTYGMLYTGYVATDSRNVCPAGWHASSENDWIELIGELGGLTVAAEKLKEIGTTHWLDPNIATNTSGFTALGSGNRTGLGGFMNLHRTASYWTSTDFHPGLSAHKYILIHDSPALDKGATLKYNASSIRCVKNITENIIVTNTNNDGPGSLRQAVLDAKTSLGLDHILFQIPGEGPHTILLEEAITIDAGNEVVIDGYSQTGAYINRNGPGEGFDVSLKIILNGSLNTTDKQAFFIFADNCTLRGLVINKFKGRGISLWSNSNTIIEGNFIGTDVTGALIEDYKLGHYAIELDESSNNTIKGNLISGNGGPLGDPTILIKDNEDPKNGSNDNLIIGNYIGTDASGELSLSNTGIGIAIREYCQRNTVGGTNPEDRNILCDGIWIGGTEANYNKVIGNYVGTDVTGMNALGSGHGIGIDGGASYNEVGPGNYISGNGRGIGILSASSSSNLVFGNTFGLGSDGEKPIPNESSCIVIEDASNNRIGGLTIDSTNVIAYSTLDHGVHIFGTSASANSIVGNYIGSVPAGTADLGSLQDGVLINGGAHDNVIGGDTPQEGNVIGHCKGNGIYLSGPSTVGNHVMGNYIGEDKQGNTVPNNRGINVDYEATLNFIGGNSLSLGNLVASNSGAGIGLGSYENYVTGNEIRDNETDGIFITGHHHRIGGALLGERNYIYNNVGSGISIFPGSNFNTIEGNFLGVGLEGKEDKTNSWDGIGIGGSDNVVKGNLVSGYTHQGILIMRWHSEETPNPNPVPERNLIEANKIGLNADGSGFIPNGHGITVDASRGNKIVGNEIAGNTFNGISISNSILPISIDNLISKNAIYENGETGIDLDADWVSLNDDDDSDEGSNHLQNFPELTSVNFSPGSVTVEGILYCEADREYEVEYFVSRLADESVIGDGSIQYGEGEMYLGTEIVGTNVSGLLSFESTLPISGFDGQVITTTATDDLGNTSEFSNALGSVSSQVISAANMTYQINVDGFPGIDDGSDISAIENSFATWSDIPTASIDFSNGGTTPERYASATDGINLVTFQDDKFPFPPGVLAVSAKTIQVASGSQAANIVDADIIFNPDYVINPEYRFGISTGEPDSKIFDIQSVTTHEIGHVLGLIHSGIPQSTMFYALGNGTINRTLEPDDMAWASYRYPNLVEFNTSYGKISGNIRYGDIVNPEQPEYHPPLAGALVLAINEAMSGGMDQQGWFHAYSDALGNYTIPVEATAEGTSYAILIRPLDGDVFGYDLRPGNISAYIYANTIYSEYPEEYYNDPDEYNDEGKVKAYVDVIAGSEKASIDLVTERDEVPPELISVSPADGSADVDIRPDIILTFNEAVNLGSFETESCHLVKGDDEDVIFQGQFDYLTDVMDIVLFRPYETLLGETAYTLHLEGVTDRKNNEMAVFESVFTTEEYDDEKAPEVLSTIPEADAMDVFIRDSILVFFSKSMDKQSLIDGFTLSYEGDSDVAGSYQVNADNTLFTFIPVSNLEEGKLYSLSLSPDVKDVGGTPVESWSGSSFSTVSTANPQVSYLGPEGSNVSVLSPVLVDFSEPIDRNTISFSSFILTGAEGVVPGSFEFLLNDSRVVFRPDNNLEYGANYSVNLSADILDVSDPSLPLQPVVSRSFTTELELAAPYLEYLDPSSAGIGTLVTIVGSGFDPKPENNLVLFNGDEGAIKSASLNTLVTEVPYEAVSGMVTVTSNGFLSSNYQNLYVIPQLLMPGEVVSDYASVGTRPRSVSVAPDAGYAYVTNFDSDNVSVINISDPSNIISEGTINVGKNPLDIAIDPEGKRAYVTNFFSHTVSVLNIDKTSDKFNTYMFDIGVGINPYGVAVAADKKVYVANYESKNVSVIDVDPASGGFDHVISNLPTGTRNRSVAVSPDAALAVVTGDDGITIIEFSPSGDYADAVISRASSGTSTRDVSIKPDAGLAIVTTMDGELQIIDIFPDSESFGKVVGSLGSRSRNVTISPDALFVYVTEENKVTVYKLIIGGSGTAEASSFLGVSLEPYNEIDLSTYNADLEELAIDPFGEVLLVVNKAKDAYTGELIVIKLADPVTAKSISDLIGVIQDLVNSGSLHHGQGDALISILNDALYNLGQDAVKGTINVLTTFIKKVKLMDKKGYLSKDEANTLIGLAELIIEELESEGIKSAKVVTDIMEYTVPSDPALGPIYPNPFSQSTIIQYSVFSVNGEVVPVRIEVYNSTGQLVKNLVEMKLTTGNYSAEWDGRYEDERVVSDGIYYVRMMAGDVQFVEKAVVIR